MNYILIIGAKSDVGKELAKIYAKNGYNLYLAGRKINELEPFQNDIKIRSNVDVKLKEFDITNIDYHLAFFKELNIKPLGVIVLVGYMANQKECELDFAKTLNTINVNYTGIVSILNIIANEYEKQKTGFIVGVSSVAGDRGRKTNYIYGSSKAAFSAYLSGLRNRLYESNVHVLTVKPGFIKSKMTSHLDLPRNLTAEPRDVAFNIYRAQQKCKDVLYIKSIWKFIMFIVRNIPEWKFKKMNI